MKVSKRIIIYGIVQGVGFRPFLYNLANSLNLKGWVINDSKGVTLHIQGEEEKISSFINSIKETPPLLSKIEGISMEDIELDNFTSFEIKESEILKNNQIFISPDISICNNCLEDILNENNSRYLYPFTNCTNCGPRFSIIKKVPYDRKTTTMNSFTQCNKCNLEYTNVKNRRFHAQPNACPSCGPKIFLISNEGENLTEKIAKDYPVNSSLYNQELLSFTMKEIEKDKIFAIKSLSGFHLCCNPFSKEAINDLRERKNRKSKPFALMVKDLDTAKKYCHLNKEEEELLLSKERPILLLRKKGDYNFPENLAPNNSSLGIMLPSTPLHHLMFKFTTLQALIMTSGNLSNNPLEYNNELAFKNLKTFCHYFLMNDRDIYLPLDDSIMKVSKKGAMIIRRSRGYAPLPFYHPTNNEILALGGDMKNSFSISKGDYIYMGPHNGELITFEGLNRYKENIAHYKALFETTPNLVVHDNHPNFNCTKYIKENKGKSFGVNHHHSHVVSAMVDNNYSGNVIGVAFDGTGYGDDNAIWGSEFLIANEKHYKRVGHLKYTNILGGDDSLRDNYKSALSYLYSLGNKEEILEKNYKELYPIIFTLLKNKKGTYPSSSMGRLFDGVASILGLCQKSSFEGEGAIALESILKKDKPSSCYSLNYEDNKGQYLLSPSNIIKEILMDLKKGISPSVISLKFHSTIVKYIVTMCNFLRLDYNINVVALSGGVFQNSFILDNAIDALENLGFQVLTHHNIPPNDGGISVGQLVIAKNNIK